MMHNPTARRLLAWLLALLLLLAAAGAAAVFLIAAHLGRDLPSVDSLRQLQLSVPLRIYSRDGKLIGEFGAERRALLRYEEVPPRLIQAFLAAEDDRFFEHPGVDWQGLMRAGLKFAASGEKSQGGSTITMQLARNVFLSSERTFTRKFKEILLALRMERELSKEEILEIYLNKIFLGERAYGVAAAALVYFDKDVQSLTLGEMAVIAGLPKAPSRDNPVSNPERARERRDYVLRRMRQLGHIAELEYQAAVAEAVTVHPYRAKVDVEADYVAEMARAELVAEYGDDAYSRGLSVVTTVDSKRQGAANAALRAALLDYDQRHGWRGAESRIPPELLQEGGAGGLREVFDRLAPVGGLIAAVVVQFRPDALSLLTAGGAVTLNKAAFDWAQLSEKNAPRPGDIVRLLPEADGYRLAQVPQVQGALVALDPDDGAVQALVGGFDFFAGKFNRVTQARRQAGSGFKPFLYSAALDYGFTPASVVLDAPVVFDDPKLESTWRPENYGGDIKGPMRVREALVQSRNLVSIRLLQAIGIETAREFIPRFGLPQDRLPQDLTMALGSAVFTPLEIARGYATIANGGFVVDPYFIEEIRDAHNETVFRARPKRACAECLEQSLLDAAASETPAAPVEEPRDWVPAARAIDPKTVWMITDMMHDVTVRGTAAKVAQLGRNDLAGKTGTTNDETDAWFNGFQRHLVAVTWVGFDQPTPLGRGEVGGRAALPAWMDFMRIALDDVAEETQPRPPGLVNVRIDPQTGRLAAVGDPDAIFETVPQERVPEPQDSLQQRREEDSDLQDLF